MSDFTKRFLFTFCLLASLSFQGCKFTPTIVEWKDGIIPYYLTGDFTEAEIADIETAMITWESASGVRFEEVTPRARAYNIIRLQEKRWSSSIGENNAVCYLNFGSSGDRFSHLLHEMGHALGLLHEHQRPDRDKYIKVFWENILNVYQENFEIRDNPLIVEENYSYDYNSIMHYPANSFSKNDFNTLVSLDDNNPINRLDILTEMDIQKAQEIYGPPLEENSN